MSSTDIIDDGFFHPGEPLKAGEMRISFMGTSVIQRRTQVCSSVFVELGIGKIDDNGNRYVWVESFVFDCGAGCTVNYTAMQVPMSRMRRIFLTHLHGDHTSDLTHIYGFGPQQDGKSPLYIYGPSASLVPDPKTGIRYDDGTINFCYHLREMNRWHTEAQSFVGTQWCAADGDGYEIRATELNWRTGGKRTWSSATPYPGPDKNPCGSGSINSYPKMAGIAYEENGVKISFFPALHDRNGSISYKLEWNGLSMIFTGDTQPNNFLIDQARSGVSPVDVLISEMVVPTEVWAAQGSQDTPSDAALKLARTVQKNSHTPENAFGFILKTLKGLGKAPRLAVATHFQAENQGTDDDTITPASNAIRSFYPDGDVVIATDLMVINVLPNPGDPKQPFIRHRPSKVSDYAWYPQPEDARGSIVPAECTTGPLCPNYKDNNGRCGQRNPLTPKYYEPDPENPYYPMAPWAQLDQWLMSKVIPAKEYDPTGWDAQNPIHSSGIYVCGK